MSCHITLEVQSPRRLMVLVYRCIHKDGLLVDVYLICNIIILVKKSGPSERSISRWKCVDIYVYFLFFYSLDFQAYS